jgi:hypothetical protein
MMRTLLLALLLVAAACSAPGIGDPASTAADGIGVSDVDTSSEPASEGSSIDGPVVVCTPLEELVQASLPSSPVTDEAFPWDRDDPVVLDGFDFSAVISGGPPPDGILPIDDPCFDSVAAADEWLEPQSPVMVVEVDGDRRAYPLAIMTQHEIVNDVVGDVPVLVTYCPLCNSGLAFERTIGTGGDAEVLDFGTSGRLFQSNLVMYDRQTRSLWSQFTGQAVVGEDLVGITLPRIATSLIGWADFAAASPDGLVLSRDSVEGRTYGRNPYVGYDTAGEGFLFDGPSDDRLRPDARVVGLGTDADPVAIPLDDLRDAGAIELEVDGSKLAVFWGPGQASALDAPRVDEGADIGSTAAFLAQDEDGDPLSFETDGDGTFTDVQTGSTWNLLGEATDGPLAGQRLTPVPLDDTFWFVWFAFQPDTTITR